MCIVEFGDFIEIYDIVPDFRTRLAKSCGAVDDASLSRKLNEYSVLAAERQAFEDGLGGAGVLYVGSFWESQSSISSGVGLGNIRITTFACLLCSIIISLESRSPMTMWTEGCLELIFLACSSVRTSPVTCQSGCFATIS